jgi:hypothetical protein
MAFANGGGSNEHPREPSGLRAVELRTEESPPGPWSSPAASSEQRSQYIYITYPIPHATTTDKTSLPFPRTPPWPRPRGLALALARVVRGLAESQLRRTEPPAPSALLYPPPYLAAAKSPRLGGRVYLLTGDALRLTERHPAPAVCGLGPSPSTTHHGVSHPPVFTRRGQWVRSLRESFCCP